MDNYEKKYIDLILNKCLCIKSAKSLLIECSMNEHYKFALEIKKEAQLYGVEDVCISVSDINELHDYLLNTSLENIKNNELIDRSKREEYAKKGGTILFLTTTIPGLMSDVSLDKIKKITDIRNEQTKYYKENVTRNIFNWCIVALPNKKWSDIVFSNDKNSYEKLWQNIIKVCMLDKDNPIEEWNKFIKKSNYYKDKLNSLKIKKLHYKNNLGTDLYIGLNENVKWCNMDDRDKNGNSVMLNMPSYEIYTTPDYKLTNGIVYSSKPLIYNDCVIVNFYIEFKDGEVINFDAKIGKDMLSEIINKDEGSKRLGEVALVEYNSSISQTGIVFKTTLFDENASCHLALGDGFPNCFENFEQFTLDDMKNKGLNSSLMHVDFMIGTSDLQIDAITDNGKINIFKNGNFNI